MTQNSPPTERICKCGHPESEHSADAGCFHAEHDNSLCVCGGFKDMSFIIPSPAEIKCADCHHPESSHTRNGCVWIMAGIESQSGLCGCQHYAPPVLPFTLEYSDGYYIEYMGQGAIDFENPEDEKFAQMIVDILNGKRPNTTRKSDA